jgi:hypothetical protein
MKLLREYIRELLTERKSDSQYVDLIDAIISSMQSGSNFADVTSEFGEDGKGMVYKVYEMKKMPLPEEGTDLIDRFKELFVTIINPNKDPEARYAKKQAEITPDDELQMFPTPTIFKKLQKSKNALGYLASEFATVLEHELTHQINKTRASGEKYRSAGGDAQFDVSSQAYENSTEEIQARLIPVISSTRKALKSKNDAVGKNLQGFIESNDAKGFINYLFDIHYQPLRLNKISDKSKKKYINRFYELFEELKDEITP